MQHERRPRLALAWLLVERLDEQCACGICWFKMCVYVRSWPVSHISVELVPGIGSLQGRMGSICTVHVNVTLCFLEERAAIMARTGIFSAFNLIRYNHEPHTQLYRPTIFTEIGVLVLLRKRPPGEGPRRPPHRRSRDGACPWTRPRRREAFLHGVVLGSFDFTGAMVAGVMTVVRSDFGSGV